MTLQEAREWLQGKRSSHDQIDALSADGGSRALVAVRAAQTDAANAERAYWVLRASREGLVVLEPGHGDD